MITFKELIYEGLKSKSTAKKEEMNKKEIEKKLLSAIKTSGAEKALSNFKKELSGLDINGTLVGPTLTNSGIKWHGNGGKENNVAYVQFWFENDEDEEYIFEFNVYTSNGDGAVEPSLWNGNTLECYIECVESGTHRLDIDGIDFAVIEYSSDPKKAGKMFNDSLKKIVKALS